MPLDSAERCWASRQSSSAQVISAIVLYLLNFPFSYVLGLARAIERGSNRRDEDHEQRATQQYQDDRWE